MQEYIPFFQGERRSITEKLAKYFEYSGLESKIDFNEEELVYILSIPADKENEAKKLYQAFYFVERERIENPENDREDDDSVEEFHNSNVLKENSLDEVLTDSYNEDPLSEIASSESTSDETASSEITSGEITLSEITSSEIAISDVNNSKIRSDSDTAGLESADNDDNPKPASLLSGSTSYVMKSEKYNDYKGTFYIFLLMGIAGVIFVILNTLEILTILNGLFPNVIMGALFLFFIYVGISTGVKAKNLKYEIEEENQLTAKINEWLSKNITKDFLTSITNEELSEELDYIKKAETIRTMLLKEFGEQNPDYLDRLIEEYYSVNFDNTESQAEI